MTTEIRKPKVTSEMVAAVLKSPNRTLKSLAEEWGVSAATISNIRSGYYNQMLPKNEPAYRLAHLTTPQGANEMKGLIVADELCGSFAPGEYERAEHIVSEINSAVERIVEYETDVQAVNITEWWVNAFEAAGGKVSGFEVTNPRAEKLECELAEAARREQWLCDEGRKRLEAQAGAEPAATSVTASENTESDSGASPELLPTQLPPDRPAPDDYMFTNMYPEDAKLRIDSEPDDKDK